MAIYRVTVKQSKVNSGERVEIKRIGALSMAYLDCKGLGLTKVLYV